MAQTATGNFAGPVTLLKPLCGLEQELAENLRSFCRQDYDTYQIVFGVRDPNDPAIAVVDALRKEFPDRDISLVVDERIIGTNLKVSNLANMFAVAKHDILVISDSDMRVAPSYIRAITAPFESSKVGATTCLYSGTARGGLASKLGAMFINDWFLPSALIPLSVGELNFCFGATMAIRRDALTAIGGFPALADFIADDYMLGRLTVDAGYKVAFVPHLVENVVHENHLKALFQHEIRWARTIRSLQPVGHALAFVTELIPISILAGAVLYGATASVPLLATPFAIALALRYALHHAVAGAAPGGGTYAPWLIPARDLFSLVVRIGSFFGTTVRWRGQSIVLERNSVSRNSPAKGRENPNTLNDRYADEKDIVSQPAHL